MLYCIVRITTRIKRPPNDISLMDLSVYHVTPLSILKKINNYNRVILIIIELYKIMMLTISCIRLLNVSSSLKISKMMRDI